MPAGLPPLFDHEGLNSIKNHHPKTVRGGALLAGPGDPPGTVPARPGGWGGVAGYADCSHSWAASGPGSPGTTQMRTLSAPAGARLG